MSNDKAILVATSSVLAEYDGRPLYIHKGVTTVRDGHPLLGTFGGYFEQLTPMFEWTDADEAAKEKAAEERKAATEAEEPVVAEPEQVPGSPAPDTAPAPKDVRAWATEQGIEVPARGKLPDAVVEQYQAAHTEA